MNLRVLRVTALSAIVAMRFVHELRSAVAGLLRLRLLLQTQRVHDEEREGNEGCKLARV